MKELDALVLILVFEEMLGPWLWVGLAVAGLALVGAIVVVLREHGVRPRRLLWAEFAAILGGAGAVLVMQAVTHSGFRDIGGPIDWVLGIAIFAAGAIATLVAAYAALGLLRRLA
jgi:hypothetical protein